MIQNKILLFSLTQILNELSYKIFHCVIVQIMIILLLMASQYKTFHVQFYAKRSWWSIIICASNSHFSWNIKSVMNVLCEMTIFIINITQNDYNYFMKMYSIDWKVNQTNRNIILTVKIIDWKRDVCYEKSDKKCKFRFLGDIVGQTQFTVFNFTAVLFCAFIVCRQLYCTF